MVHKEILWEAQSEVFFHQNFRHLNRFSISLYDASLSTAVLAPLENFITGIQSISPHFQGQLLTCGLNGKINNIPANFTHTSILVAGQGINSTFYQFGEILLSYYNKNRTSNYANLSLQKLGYVTGNGAYYYYKYRFLQSLTHFP